MIKKTLTSLVLGTSLLFGSAKADVIDVPTNTTDLQQYVDMAQPGDTLNIVYTNGFPGLFSSAIVNKDINFEGNGLLLTGDFGNPDLLTIIGNANVIMNNMGVYSNGGYAINVADSASLTYQNTELLQGTIYFNSTGNLNVNNVSRLATEYSTYKTQIHLEKIVGSINISKNTFVESNRGIYIGQDFRSNLNILNNTINNISNDVIEISSLLNGEGYISNNSISNSGLDIKNPENLGNIIFTNNNIFNTLDPPGENFYLDPMYVDPNSNNFQLQSDSPLWNKGLYIEGLTTWFPSENQTWIGAYGNVVPEPSILELLVISGLSGLGYKLLRKKQ